MRKNGILMHISSLPSPYGIGKLGDSAYAFVDFLADSGVQMWQILPLNPTSYGDSPYQSFSVFAGNPYFIDFEQLERAGLLSRSDYADINWGNDPRRVDYIRVYNYCFQVLRGAFDNFDRTNSVYRDFVEENRFWLEEYALFMALKDANGGKPWYLWDKKLALRKPETIETAKKDYADDIAFYCVMQFWFYQQWERLKAYCAEKHISIIGDIPIYAAYDSADVWAHPELFQMDKTRTPRAVAGCPPDEFSETGQLWGNPVYDWDYHKKTDYAWWIQRFRHAMSTYHIVRIDHFRGFESYYSVPFGKLTAEIGIWRNGPGLDLFRAAQAQLGPLPVIAEDLGFVTPAVRKLLEDTGFPGMKVLQFAFDGDPKNENLPHNFATSHCVVYTGTHDNATLRGWALESSTNTIAFAKRYLHCRTSADLTTEILRAAWSSVAELAIAQMQDFLDTGADGRMNTPSTLGQNWQYRTINADFTSRLAKRIYRINELYNRLPENQAMLAARAARSGRSKLKEKNAFRRNAEANDRTRRYSKSSPPRVTGRRRRRTNQDKTESET